MEDEDAEQLDGKFGIPFDATIAKPNGDRVMFSCVATHTQCTVMHVSFLRSDVGEEDESVYGGPRFNDLDPAVQGGFQQYLGEWVIERGLLCPAVLFLIYIHIVYLPPLLQPTEVLTTT